PSGRVLGKCTTGPDGGCILPALDKERLDKTPALALVASKDSRLTYLAFKDVIVSNSRHDISGLPYKDTKEYRAAMYSDRGVYRPGDTVRIAAVLRTPDHKAPPAAMPVELQLRDARNRIVRKIDVPTNEGGQITGSFPLGDFADTGTYNTRLSVGDKLISSYTFKVEEFVPERMKVTAEMARKAFGPGEPVTANITARYLFGGSAKGSPIDGQWTLSPSAFRPSKNGDYRYGPELSAEAKQQSGRMVGWVKSRIGDGPVSAPPDLGVVGPSDLVLKVAVLEAGSGRKTKGQTKAIIHPADHYVGLKGDRKKLVAGEPSTIQGILVNYDGEVLSDRNGSVDVELLRIDERYGWVWDPVARRGRSRHYRKEISEQKQTVSVKNGRFQVTVQAGQDGGQFYVRAQSGEARTDLTLAGKGRYRWWWSGRSNQSQTPKPQEALALPINLPKAVEVGKAAEAVLNLPMKGRLLMTLETDQLVHSEWIDAEAGAFRWSFKVPSFVPNIYVSAFLIRSPDETAGAFLPARAYGVGSVSVKPLEYLETVSVSVPESVRSQSKLEVKLSMGRRVAKRFVTVAVVDEGILQLTRFKTPNPLPHLFPRRALQMQTFETVGWNISIPAAQDGDHDGGGDGARPGGRVQPVKPVALWSGPVAVPEDGNLTLPFELPPYRGELRVMVMAAGESTVGHAEAKVTVADPLVVQATLPRFLSQGDRLRVPVFVSNLSGSKQNIDVRLEATDLAEAGLEPFIGGSTEVLEVIGERQKQVSLEDKGSATLEFQLRGLAAVGAGQVTVTAKAGALVSEEKAQFPFLPAAPRSRRSVVVELEGGETDLKPHLEGWLPTTERSRFMVSNTPYASSFEHLRYLIRYPYGCIEQTSSSTRPLLFVSSLLRAVDPESAAKHDLEAMVQSGIDRLFSMQTGHGGFAYWPGGNQPVVWGTAYATHVLLDAKKAGYPVDAYRLDQALDWLAQNSDAQKGRHYWHWGQAAYASYVLALVGRGNKAAMKRALTALEISRFARRPHGWDAETRYLLQAGLYLAGDRSYEKQLRNPEIEAISQERSNDWTFYSDLRRWGVILDTHAQLFGIHGSGEAVADHVARTLSAHRSRYFSTQELAWAVSGLGRRLQPPAQRPKAMTLFAAGSKVKPLDNKGDKGLPAWSLYRASEYGSLKLKVSGKTEGKMYLVISSEGIARDAVYEYGGNGLVVSRNYRRRSDGRILDLTTERLKLGEVVDVELTLSNSSAAAINNIALVDRFPAGLEMETARLGSAAGQPRNWLNRRLEMRPDHVNNRDDRVEMFLTLGRRRTVKAGYSLRATTSGQFRMPPTEAEAMYDPRLWARAKGGNLTVLAPGQEQTD
ncbi:MAG: hypothetical protein CMH55_10485, partial [Myxococcales bacterium]|nr:hypothetical protein [Myxococcales bacterium]